MCKWERERTVWYILHGGQKEDCCVLTYGIISMSLGLAP